MGIVQRDQATVEQLGLMMAGSRIEEVGLQSTETA